MGDTATIAPEAEQEVTLEVFLTMTPEQIAELPKSKQKKLGKLAEGYRKKQAKAAKNEAEAAAAAAVSTQDGSKSKKEKKKKADVVEEYVNTTPKGHFKDMSAPMLSGYNPKAVEDAWYDWWEETKLFSPEQELIDRAHELPESERFIMVIPPPNVTGSLHLGHTLMCSIEDALTRWHKMSGHLTLWLPGVDHAGIATQVVVEKMMWKENKTTRHDIGREAFVAKVWEWKELYGARICSQLRRLGAACDWTREEFTLSKKLSKAVTEAFVRMYERGLLYRETRLVNWCCRLRSSLSDIEVDYIDIPGKTLMKVPGYDHEVEFGVLTKFAYKLENSDDEIVIATTRLETMLGDVAVAVHPDDERYKAFVGKNLLHPFVDRKLPIITDAELVDMNFGTGAVKITPAHDPNDFNTGKKHNLPEIIIFTDDGLMADNCGQFTGLPRYQARRDIEKALKKLDQLRGKDENPMRLGICSKTNDVIEPFVKPQWYVKCKDMADQATAASRSGELTILPEIFQPTWYQWMDNIRDWCISRQLWWGHRIPAYKYEDANGSQWFVGRTKEEALSKAAITLRKSEDEITLEQDEDVLDTWFSSGLFPFSVFGWPDETSSDLKAFYPTSVLETGHDILFFWVARMVMMGLTLTGKLPFHTVYLHAMVRDKYGRKMSKSLGNVIDPLEVIEGATLAELQAKLKKGNLDEKEIEKASKGQELDYPNGFPECGADALRYGLLAFTIQSRDINLDVDRVAAYRNFCNKLWNATKFAISNLGEDFKYTDEKFAKALERGRPLNLWIISRLNECARLCDQGFRNFALSDNVTATYNFWLYELCDIYLEAIKPAMRGDNMDEKEGVQAVLYYCLENGLRLLHPLMPFVTEELYQRLPGRDYVNPKSILLSKFPIYEETRNYPSAVRQISAAMQATKAARSLKSTYNLKNNSRPNIYVTCRTPESKDDVDKILDIIETLAGGKDVKTVKHGEEGIPAECASLIVDETMGVSIGLAGLIDVESELVKLKATANAKKIQMESIEKKVNAPDFATKTPENVQAATMEKLEKFKQELASIEEMMESFSKMLKK